MCRNGLSALLRRPVARQRGIVVEQRVVLGVLADDGDDLASSGSSTRCSRCLRHASTYMRRRLERSWSWKNGMTAQGRAGLRRARCRFAAPARAVRDLRDAGTHRAQRLRGGSAQMATGQRGHSGLRALQM